jgi:plasmid stabilization system protein ParE
VARRYLGALEATLVLLCHEPGLGRRRRFRHPLLRGFRSFRVNPPFNCHLIFYRYDDTTLYAERVMHGARELVTAAGGSA